MNRKKIHSIILSVTCHSFRSFSPTHTQPLISICESSKPYKWGGWVIKGCGGSYRGGVGWGGSCWGGVGHAGVGLVIQGWGGSCSKTT